MAGSPLWGSPPLARGTVLCRGLLAVLQGITPACAGNSITGAGRPQARRDHPRLRGEQFVSPRSVYIAWGSPPLARGTVETLAGSLTETGITPACAGNSGFLRRNLLELRDHPRLRGEQLPGFDKGRLRLGSPPLARGTAKCSSVALRMKGITPACAGNRLKKDLLYLVFYNIVFHFSISFS